MADDGVSEERATLTVEEIEKKTIPLSLAVPQGRCATVGHDESIGTTGIATCVGLIVVDDQNCKTCAHFDVGKESLGNDVIIGDHTTAILEKSFPSVEKTTRAGYATTSVEPSTISVVKAIKKRYGIKIEEGSHENLTITATKSGKIRLPLDSYLLPAPKNQDEIEYGNASIP